MKEKNGDQWLLPPGYKVKKLPRILPKRSIYDEPRPDRDSLKVIYLDVPTDKEEADNE
jgi:hypothetical protein